MVPQIFLVSVYQDILWPCLGFCLPALGDQSRSEGYRTLRIRDVTKGPADLACGLNDTRNIAFELKCIIASTESSSLFYINEETEACPMTELVSDSLDVDAIQMTPPLTLFPLFTHGSIFRSKVLVISVSRRVTLTVRDKGFPNNKPCYLQHFNL